MRDGTKYYFDKNGVMAKNKRINFSDGSYYFKSDGKMAVDYCLTIMTENFQTKLFSDSE